MDLAREELKRQSFDTCYPIYRTRKIVRHAVRETEHPMFPGYMPVAFDEDMQPWQRINNTRGVKRLMCVTNEEYTRPIPLPANEMADLLARVAEGPIYDLTKVEIFKRGQTLRVIDGPFTDFEGLCAWSGKQRVHILLTLFGRQTKVKLEPAQVKLAA